MRGRGGQKMSVFVHAQGIKTVHAGGCQKMAKFCPRSCWMPPYAPSDSCFFGLKVKMSLIYVSSQQFLLHFYWPCDYSHSNIPNFVSLLKTSQKLPNFYYALFQFCSLVQTQSDRRKHGLFGRTISSFEAKRHWWWVQIQLENYCSSTGVHDSFVRGNFSLRKLVIFMNFFCKINIPFFVGYGQNGLFRPSFAQACQRSLSSLEQICNQSGPTWYSFWRWLLFLITITLVVYQRIQFHSESYFKFNYSFFCFWGGKVAEILARGFFSSGN